MVTPTKDQSRVKSTFWAKSRDFVWSQTSAAISKKTNQSWIAIKRILQQVSVLVTPTFEDATYQKIKSGLE